jgi:hypothetical protein
MLQVRSAIDTDEVLAQVSQRTREMYALYADGATLEEVGSRFRLTRERVRQVFQEAGLPTRSITETHALRHDRLLSERSDEIRSAFSESEDVEEVSQRLGVPRVVVKEIADRHFPHSAESRQKLRRRPPLYPPDELITFLQQAGAAVPGKLTTGKYAKYASRRHTDDGRPWPSFQTHAKRFDTWRKALAQAGVER